MCTLLVSEWRVMKGRRCRSTSHAPLPSVMSLLMTVKRKGCTCRLLLLSLRLLLMVCATWLVTSHTPHCCHSLPRQHHQPHHHQAHRQAPHQAHRRTLHRALRWPSPQPFHPPVCCDPIVVCAPQQHRMAHIRLFFQSKVITGYLRTDRAEHLASFFFYMPYISRRHDSAHQYWRGPARSSRLH